MTEQLTSPEDTYEQLMNEARDSRRKRSLDAINECCRLLYERQTSDFSYKTIITLGKDRGLSIPSEKSIVNSTGEHYRELIHAWRQLASLPKKSSAKASHGDWIDCIEDPVLRMSVLRQAKRLRAYEAKEARKSVMSGAPIILNNAAGQAVSAQPRLNDAEISALRAAIDPEVLRLIGLSIGTRGEVFDTKGRIVQKPGFRDAIEKILSVQLISLALAQSHLN